MIIRWKVFIPVFLIVVGIWAFAFFRLDLLVKGSIESAVSAATGTKTDISHLRISFIDSSLKIRRLEIASKENPMKNAVELNEIILDFQFLPLLEKRLVVDRFAVTGIQWGTARKTSGELPPEPKSKEPGLFSEISEEALTSLQTEFDQLPVAKLTDFEIPKDPGEILKKIDLASLTAFKDASIEIQGARSQWMGRYQEIRDINEYRQMIADGRALVSSAPNNPEEILSRVQQAQSLIEKFQAEKKDLENLMGEFQTDYSKMKSLVEGAQKAVGEDYQRAKALVGFDAFDASAITKMIFGTQWVSRAEQVLRVQNLLRSKLALLSAQGKDEQIQVRPRAKGRDIIFVTPQRKPGFVLAASDFSVNVLNQGRREQIDEHYGLKLKDLNSNPRLYGKPMTLGMKVELKDRILSSATLDAQWDYTQDVPSDSYRAQVNRIKAESWPVGIPRYFPVKIDSGEAQANVDLQFVGSEMSWVNRVNFSNVKWNFGQVPKSGVLAPILFEVFEGAHQFWLSFKLSYKEGRLTFDVLSDLDEKLKDGIGRYLEMRAKEFLARLDREIEARIASAKNQAMQELSKFSGDAEQKLQSVANEVGQYTREAEGLVGQLQDKAKAAAEQKLQNEVGEKLKQALPKSLPKIKF